MKRLAWIVCLVMISACGADAPSGNDGLAEIESNTDNPVIFLDQMQGSWISDDDPQNVITINEKTLTSVYGGQHLGEETILFVGDCFEMVADPNGNAFTLNDGGPDLRCFTMLTVNDDKLVYSYFPRGNTLSYSRVEG